MNTIRGRLRTGGCLVELLEDRRLFSAIGIPGHVTLHPVHHLHGAGEKQVLLATLSGPDVAALNLQVDPVPFQAQIVWASAPEAAHEIGVIVPGPRGTLKI